MQAIEVPDSKTQMIYVQSQHYSIVDGSYSAEKLNDQWSGAGHGRHVVYQQVSCGIVRVVGIVELCYLGSFRSSGQGHEFRNIAEWNCRKQCVLCTWMLICVSALCTLLGSRGLSNCSRFAANGSVKCFACDSKLLMLLAVQRTPENRQQAHVTQAVCGCKHMSPRQCVFLFVYHVYLAQASGSRFMFRFIQVRPTTVKWKERSERKNHMMQIRAVPGRVI